MPSSVSSSLSIFILILSLTQNFAVGQEKPEKLGYFYDIIQVHEIDSTTIAIVSNGGTHHVTIYSLDKNEVLSSFIRNGRGPGEIMRAEASLLERSSGELCYMSRLLPENSSHSIWRPKRL